MIRSFYWYFELAHWLRVLCYYLSGRNEMRNIGENIRAVHADMKLLAGQVPSVRLKPNPCAQATAHAR